MPPEVNPSASRQLFARLEHSTTFYLVRHGESEGNRELRIQGKTDRPLTDLGREHARKAGTWLARHPVDALFASPLVRAEETARIIDSSLAGSQPGAPELPVRLDPDLEELETGIFSDRTFAELQAQMPDEWREFSCHSWEGVPGAEKIADLEARALRVWNRLVDCANQGHRRIVAVSHGGFIHWLIRTTFATGWNSWFPRIRISNCAISELRVEVLPGQPERICMAEWYQLAQQPWA